MRRSIRRISRRLGASARRPTRWTSPVLIVLSILLPTRALALDGAFYRSLAIPGTGQAHQGHMTKAALFAGTAVITGVGLAVSGIQYNQAVDRFRNEKRKLAALLDQVNSGRVVVSIDDINARSDAMHDAFNSADDRLVWRNVFLVSFLSVYALNIADVLRSDAHDPDVALRYSIDANRERVLLTRSFRF